MDDLVKRLRTPIPMKQSFSGYYPDLTALAALREEAAAALEAKDAEITALRAEVERRTHLHKALQIVALDLKQKLDTLTDCAALQAGG